MYYQNNFCNPKTNSNYEIERWEGRGGGRLAKKHVIQELV